MNDPSPVQGGVLEVAGDFLAAGPPPPSVSLAKCVQHASVAQQGMVHQLPLLVLGACADAGKVYVATVQPLSGTLVLGHYTAAFDSNRFQTCVKLKSYAFIYQEIILISFAQNQFHPLNHF